MARESAASSVKASGREDILSRPSGETKQLAALGHGVAGDCSEIDAFAARLYGLDADERDLVRDAIGRGRATFIDSLDSRVDDASPPKPGDVAE